MAKISAKELKARIVDGQCDEAARTVAERLSGLEEAERDKVAERLGDVVQEAYDDYANSEVDAFIQIVRSSIGASVAQVFEKKVAECNRLTTEWRSKLRRLEPERLARNLRESVRARELDDAIERLERLVEGHANDPNFDQRLRYIGGILGSLPNDQPSVAKLFQMAGRHGVEVGLTPAHVAVMEKACANRLTQLAKESAINREREYSATLTQLSVELNRLLPSAESSREVSPDQVRVFKTNLRAIVRTVFLPDDPISWRDLTDLFSEFVASPLSVAGRRGGVEGRLWNYLKPGARATARRVFIETGELPVVQQSIMNYGETVRTPRALTRLAEVMGLLGANAFTAFLQRKLSQRREESVRAAIIEAIGKLTGTESSGTLIAQVRKHIRGAVTQGVDRRVVLNTLNSLGGYIRSQRVDDSERRKAIDQLIAMAPAKDPRLELQFALNLLPDDPMRTLTGEQREWFMRSFARGLWLGEETPEFAGGDDAQRTFLGWREPIVEAIENFGEAGLHDFVKAAEPLSIRYSAAFLALAEIGTRIGDQRMLPLLESCVDVAAAHDESAESRYARETFYDSTDGERKPIRRNMIVTALIYAIHRIGGKRAREVLLDIYRRVSDGEIEKPGGEATKILLDIHFEHEKKEKARTGNDKPARGEAKKETAPTLSPEKIDELVEEVRRFRLLPSKRRATKVPAIHALGAARAPDAIEPLIEQLTNKDEYIAAAAGTALKQYGDYRASPDLINHLVTHCVEYMDSGDKRLRNILVDLLIELSPGRKELREPLTREFQMAEPGSKLRHAIARVLEHAGFGKEGAEDAEGETAGAVRAEASQSAADQLAQRREYFAKRKAWIESGKVGDEPERPAGV